MGGDDRRRSFGDLLRLCLLLACLGSQAVSGEWLSFRGCWNLTSSGDMVINLTNNGPSACLNACPENTTVLALQGHVCECRSTLIGTHVFRPTCSLCSVGDNGECEVTGDLSWYIYEKVDNNALGGYTLLQQNETKCLAVNNTSPLKYQVRDCDTTLPALCNELLSPEKCFQTSITVWNETEIEKRCNEQSPGAFLVGQVEIGKCKGTPVLIGGSTTNVKQFWTGLRFIPRNSSFTITTSSVIDTSTLSAPSSVIQTTMTNSPETSSLASSTVSVIAYTNSDITSTAHSTTHSAVISSMASSEMNSTSSSSTTVATSIATTTSSTVGTDKQRAIVIGASIGVVAALLLVVIGVGAYCMVRKNRGKRRVKDTNNAMTEITTVRRNMGSRAPSVVTDSGIVDDILKNEEMPEPDFTSQNHLPETAQSSLPHNGLTSTKDLSYQF